MLTKRLPIVLFVGAVLVAAAAGYAYFLATPGSSAPGELSASGTIEATHVLIAPELAGKVAEVLVKEGDAVHPLQFGPFGVEQDVHRQVAGQVA